MTSLSHGGSAAVDSFSLGTLKDSLSSAAQTSTALVVFGSSLQLQSHALKGNAGDAFNHPSALPNAWIKIDAP